MRRTWMIGLLVIALIAAACRSSTTVEPVAQPEEPAEPGATAVSTPLPVPTPTPTAAPAATVVPTPVPTVTSLPTPTPVPYAPGAAAALEPGGPLDGMRIGLIANQASVVDGVSTIDLFARSEHVDLATIFAPEHGPRGVLGAGELVADGVDEATGLAVVSLYGPGGPRPTQADLEGLDALVYDLQDVGTRFYTYISTMGIAMQAAREAGIPFVVLDRPNPIAPIEPSGFTLGYDYDSFIGLYPIPAVYGLTAGELAQAIVGEQWLLGLMTLDLRVVPMQGWHRDLAWSELGVEWVAPSPGLPTFDAALAYPATVLFEATTLSYGRGTDDVFGQIGAPWVDAEALVMELEAAGLDGVRFEPVSFVPEQGDLSEPPPFDGQVVSGVRWVVEDPSRYDPVAAGVAALVAVVEQGREVGIEVIDRPEFLHLLAGTDELYVSIQAGASSAEIVASWQDDLALFDPAMVPYLLYPS